MILIKRILSKIWQCGCMANDKLFYHGADFGRWKEVDELGIDESHGNPYQTSTPGNLKRALRDMKITDKDSVLDIGCGKGRTMYILSKFPFRKIDGYDISEELVRTANENFNLLNVDDRCRAVTDDAETFDGYDDYDYLYLFNSVPREVFKSLIHNIQLSLKRRPRKVVLMYMHPEHEQYLLENSDFVPAGRYRSPMTLFVDWFDLAVYTNGK